MRIVIMQDQDVIDLAVVLNIVPETDNAGANTSEILSSKGDGVRSCSCRRGSTALNKVSCWRGLG